MGRRNVWGDTGKLRAGRVVVRNRLEKGPLGEPRYSFFLLCSLQENRATLTAIIQVSFPNIFLALNMLTWRRVSR